MSEIDAGTVPAGEVEQAPLLERLSDRLSPILVKEVRQAMRGNYFKITFWITLAVATLVGLGVCLEGATDGRLDEALGRPFFTALFACLIGATQVLVPFSSFLSMGGEWDENTWDLLVLSNLKPRQIVLGKVLSAGVQALLYYCAFGPFLVFAFLLHGLDLGVLFTTLGVSLVVSLLLSCLGVAMSCFGQGKFTRVLLMVLLTAALVWATIGTGAWAGAMMYRPGMLYDPEMLEAIGGSLTVGLAVAAFFFAAACSRLAHPEENRSSGLRTMSLVVVGSGLTWVSWIMRSSSDREGLLVTSCLAITFLFVTSIFYSTEPGRLGLRVAATLPMNRLRGWLALPMLPGGMRGLIFFVCASLLVLAWFFVHPLVVNGSLPFRHGQAFIPPMLIVAGFIYLGLPGGLMTKALHEGWARIVARVSVVMLFIASIILPALIGYMLDVSRWDVWEHPLNIFMMMDYLWDHEPRFTGGAAFVLAMVVLTCLVNAPRTLTMLKEHSKALAHRRWIHEQQQAREQATQRAEAP